MDTTIIFTCKLSPVFANLKDIWHLQMSTHGSGMQILGNSTMCTVCQLRSQGSTKRHFLRPQGSKLMSSTARGNRMARRLAYLLHPQTYCIPINVPFFEFTNSNHESKNILILFRPVKCFEVRVMPQARGDVHHWTTELEPFVSLQTFFPIVETAWSPPSQMCTWCLPCFDRKTCCMTESKFGYSPLCQPALFNTRKIFKLVLAYSIAQQFRDPRLFFGVHLLYSRSWQRHAPLHRGPCLHVLLAKFRDIEWWTARAFAEVVPQIADRESVQEPGWGNQVRWEPSVISIWLQKKTPSKLCPFGLFEVWDQNGTISA